MDEERQILGIETVRVEDLSSVLDNIPVVKNVKDLEALGIVETVGYIEPIGFINQKGSLESLNIAPRKHIESVGIVKNILANNVSKRNNLRNFHQPIISSNNRAAFPSTRRSSYRILDPVENIGPVDIPEPIISPDNPAAFHFLGNTKKSASTKTFTPLKPVVSTNYNKPINIVNRNNSPEAIRFVKSMGFNEELECFRISKYPQTTDILKHMRQSDQVISPDNPAAFHFLKSEKDRKKREALQKVEDYVQNQLNIEPNPAAFHFMPSPRTEEIEIDESDKYFNPTENLENITYVDLSTSHNTSDNTIYIDSANLLDSTVEVIDYIEPHRIQEVNNIEPINMKNYPDVIEKRNEKNEMNMQGQSLKNTNLEFYDSLKILNSLYKSQNENNSPAANNENHDIAPVEQLPKFVKINKASNKNADESIKNEHQPEKDAVKDKLKTTPLPDDNNNQTSTEEKRFKCDTCGHETNHKGNFKKHLLIHSGQKPFACDYCGYRCFYKHYLEIHMLFHKGVKPYKCEQCGTKFTAKCDLTRHMKIHTQEKHHSCTHCDYKTSRKSYLKVHMRSHTGEKPYECKVCGKKFSQKNNMTQHYSVIHGEQTLHTCTDCNKEFTKKEQLLHHRRLNHLNDNININMMNRHK